jgi:hypothetical protein
MDSNKLGYKRKLFRHASLADIQKNTEDTSMSVIDFIQNKVSSLENKYKIFVNSCIKKLSRDNIRINSISNNNLMIKKPFRSQGTIKDYKKSGETKEYRSILENFVQLANKVPKELELDLTKLKTDTLAVIQDLEESLSSCLKELKHLKFSSKGSSEPGSIKKAVQSINDNIAKEPDSRIALSNELCKSKESIMILRNKIYSQFKLETSNVPKLNLNDMPSKSPIPAHYDRSSNTTSRARKQSVSVVRDSMNHKQGIIELETPFQVLVSCVKSFVKSIKSACEQSFTKENDKILLIQQLSEDFMFNFSNLQPKEPVPETCKLQEQLETCKKIVSMYENKLKIKNETISDLRKKNKEFYHENNNAKCITDCFFKAQLDFFNNFTQKTESKLDNIRYKLKAIEEKIRKKSQIHIEGLKESIKISEKNKFLDQQVEILTKKIEDLEETNKNFYPVISKLQDDNHHSKNKILENENIIKNLKEEIVDSKNLITELEENINYYENIQKNVKIKEFELKQLEYEKTQLTSDKIELLNRIETLEIEIIEARESYQQIYIKYNQEIEELIFSNTFYKNKISSLEKSAPFHNQSPKKDNKNPGLDTKKVAEKLNNLRFCHESYILTTVHAKPSTKDGILPENSLGRHYEEELSYNSII